MHRRQPMASNAFSLKQSRQISLFRTDRDRLIARAVKAAHHVDQHDLGAAYRACVADIRDTYRAPVVMPK